MAALMKFDTLSWAKKLEKAGVPSQQAEVQVELIFRAIDDNVCTKQDLRELDGNINIKLKELESNVNVKLKELELKIEEVRKDLAVSTEESRKNLAVSIEEVRKDLAVSTEEGRKNLAVAIEKVNASIEKVKGALQKQIAGWVLGVSAVQATLIIGIIRYVH